MNFKKSYRSGGKIMRTKILNLIEKNSKLEVKDIAAMLEAPEAAVAQEIAAMEKEHIICG